MIFVIVVVVALFFGCDFLQGFLEVFWFRGMDGLVSDWVWGRIGLLFEWFDGRDFDFFLFGISKVLCLRLQNFK